MGHNHFSPSSPAISRACRSIALQLRSEGQPAGIDAASQQRQHRRDQGICQQHTYPRHQNPAMPIERISLMGTVRSAKKSDGHRRGRNQERAACVARRDQEAWVRRFPRSDRLAEAADHQQRVIDPQTQTSMVARF